MNSKKGTKNYFLIFMILLFIVFIVLYLAQMNGYYEYREYNKMIITEEAMQKFESDVREGKNIEVENYLENTYKDYSNNISKLGLKTGEFVESIMTEGLGKTIKVLEALFTN